MSDKPFIAPELHSKHARDALHFGQRSGQKMPGLGTGVPDSRVLLDGVVLIVLRIDDDGEQDQIFSQNSRKTFLQVCQMTGETKAISRIWAAHVGEAESYNLAFELRELYFVTRLIGECEIRHCLLDLKRFRGSGWVRQLAHNGEAAGFERFLLQVLVTMGANIFRVGGISIDHDREINILSGPYTVKHFGVPNVEWHRHGIHVARNTGAGYSHGFVGHIHSQYQT